MGDFYTILRSYSLMCDFQCRNMDICPVKPLRQAWETAVPPPVAPAGIEGRGAAGGG